MAKKPKPILTSVTLNIGQWGVYDSAPGGAYVYHLHIGTFCLKMERKTVKELLATGLFVYDGRRTYTWRTNGYTDRTASFKLK